MVLRVPERPAEIRVLLNEHVVRRLMTRRKVAWISRDQEHRTLRVDWRDLNGRHHCHFTLSHRNALSYCRNLMASGRVYTFRTVGNVLGSSNSDRWVPKIPPDTNIRNDLVF